MNQRERGEKTDERRLVEASAWRVYLVDNDLRSTPAFEDWLNADARNRAAWDSVQYSWELLGQHATSPELLDLRRRSLGRVRAMGRKRWAALPAWPIRFRDAAIAAGLILAVLAGGVTFHLVGPQTYRTDAGERRVITLSDGSKVQLDSLTHIRVDYSEHSRHLELTKGQARFDVARDVKRPFSVAAAGRTVVATQTAFNVDLLGKNLFVTLLEGRVMILPPSDTTRSTPPAEPIELQAGQQLAVIESGPSMVVPMSAQRAMAWQSGRIVVENEPLSLIVMRVNRYATRRVELEDEHAASLRISGVFNAGDVDGFVATVTNYLAVTAERAGDVIYLSAAAAPASVP